MWVGVTDTVIAAKSINTGSYSGVSIISWVAWDGFRMAAL